MSEPLTDQQIREACIRMEGSAEKRREILAKVSPIMDMSDEIAKLRWERDRLSAALDRATDQLVHAAKTIAELESALKVKLF